MPLPIIGTNASLKSNDGEYAVELTDNMNKKIFTGSDKDDTLNIAADNAAVIGGSGDDFFLSAVPQSLLRAGRATTFSN